MQRRFEFEFEDKSPNGISFEYDETLGEKLSVTPGSRRCAMSEPPVIPTSRCGMQRGRRFFSTVALRLRR